MRVQRISPRITKQALRTRPAPEGLNFWLDLIRDIPADYEVSEWETPDVSRSRDALGELLRSYDTKISKLPAPTQRWVRGDRNVLDVKNLVVVGERYRQVKAAHEILRAIAREELSDVATHSEDLIGLRIDEQGLIKLIPSRLFTALDGLEAQRIRECENSKCLRIYWAGRLDQPCCSRKCANARRVKKWRERYQDRYKQNRLSRNLKKGR